MCTYTDIHRYIHAQRYIGRQTDRQTQASGELSALTRLPGTHKTSAPGFSLKETTGWGRSKASDRAEHGHATRTLLSLLTIPQPPGPD
jgi:hypothetical protein